MCEDLKEFRRKFAVHHTKLMLLHFAPSKTSPGGLRVSCEGSSSARLLLLASSLASVQVIVLNTNLLECMHTTANGLWWQDFPHKVRHCCLSAPPLSACLPDCSLSLQDDDAPEVSDFQAQLHSYFDDQVELRCLACCLSRCCSSAALAVFLTAVLAVCLLACWLACRPG